MSDTRQPEACKRRASEDAPDPLGQRRKFEASTESLTAPAHGTADSDRKAAATTATSATTAASTASSARPIVLSSAHSRLGRRENNEDYHVEGIMLENIGKFFAVYDGHNGADCSGFLASSLHKVMAEHISRGFKRAECKPDDVQQRLKELQTTLDTLAKEKQQIIVAQALLRQQEQVQREQQEQQGQEQQGQQGDQQQQQGDDSIEALLKDIDVACAAASEEIETLLAEPVDCVHTGFHAHMMKHVKSAFREADASYLDRARRNRSHQGATALTVTVQGKSIDAMQMLIANTGDSRAVR
jgi:serine/threonine protein phosphatase PrpC